VGEKLTTRRCGDARAGNGDNVLLVAESVDEQFHLILLLVGGLGQIEILSGALFGQGVASPLLRGRRAVLARRILSILR
jgi:hypothetical protein